MAKIKFGAIITDSRGTVGGMSLKWSRFGNVLLKKPQTAKLQTPKQTTARNSFVTYSKRWWAELTPTQRTDWRALAAANPRPNVWGTDYPLTGLALFIGINRLLTQAGASPTNDAPTDQAVTAIATATLTVTAPSTATLAFTPTPCPTDHVLYLAALGPISPGVTNYGRNFRFLLASASSETSPLTISSALSSLCNGLTSGRQYVVSARFLNLSNGALSPELIAPTIAT